MDVKAIRTRLQEASHGPWVLGNVNSEHLHDICLGYPIPGEGNPVMIASVYGGEEYYEPLDLKTTNANARLIANAPTDLTYLLDRLEKTEGLLRDLCNDSLAVQRVMKYREALELIAGNGPVEAAKIARKALEA